MDWDRGRKAVHVSCPPAPVVNVTPKPVAVVSGVARIVAFLSLPHAQGKLKQPKLRFLAPDGKSELRLSLATERSRTPGAVFVKLGYSYVGKINPDGTTTITDKPMLDTLDAIGNDPAKAAAAYGALFGRCTFCGLELTDDGSVEVGYGPICAGHYGLPHKAKGVRTVKRVGAVAPAAKPIENVDGFNNVN